MMIEPPCHQDDTWRLGLKKFYGASASSKWQQLAVDIECVANALKPAYLLDTLPPNPHLFRSFLDHVLLSEDPQRSAVVREWLCNLRVVALGSDVLVINKTAIEELFQSSCVYIDISRAENGAISGKPDSHIRIHSSTDVEEQCRQWYSTLRTTELEQTNKTASEPSRGHSVMLLSVPLGRDMNMCTLFGRLLGYPVVYWFPPSTDYCLDTVDLVRHQVNLSCENRKVNICLPILLFLLLCEYKIFYAANKKQHFQKSNES